MESNSPRFPVYTTAPSNFKKVIDAHVANSTRRALDEYAGFSFGNVDGRFANSLPTPVQNMTDPYGREYHRVGFHVGGDLSVAAP